MDRVPPPQPDIIFFPHSLDLEVEMDVDLMIAKWVAERNLHMKGILLYNELVAIFNETVITDPIFLKIGDFASMAAALIDAKVEALETPGLLPCDRKKILLRIRTFMYRTRDVILSDEKVPVNPDFNI